MRLRLVALALLAVLVAWVPASAQSQTGSIFGKATDDSGGVLPGVSVTLTSPILLQPLTAVTSETGTYQFPRLAIGSYTVKFELTGFKTVIVPDIKVTVGFNAQINGQLGVSAIQETITVSGEAPVVDTKEVGTKQTFTLEVLQTIPSARDPWVILQQTAGIAMDRENIGGNMSGQQSNYISRGGSPANAKWSLDGVDITDLSSQSSPSYYDFDAFEEMTINTGGVDVTQQTGGVGINLVTKSGSDRFRGSGRFFLTDEKFEAQNVTDALRNQGATAGNPIQNVKDFGVEMGGPLKKGKAWIWGSFGKQIIDVGVVGFYKTDAACQAIKASLGSNPLAASIDDVNKCLNTDETLLQTTNLKAEVQLFKGNKLSLFNNFAKKVRNARGADDLHPIETTNVQDAVPTIYGVGKNWWTIGPNPTFKFSDQWVLSDKFLLDVQYGHVGNNFVLDLHDPSLTTVQSTILISTSLVGRSATQNIYVRPSNIVNFNANYFLPGVGGADHSFKFGGYVRDNYSYSYTHTGGNAILRFPTAAELANPNDCATQAIGCQVNLTRDGLGIYDLQNISVYGQDTIKKDKMTIQAGLRFDRNHDQALAASVSASPLMPALLPAVSFGGVDPGIIFNNISPRVGVTYDLMGDGKSVFHANYAIYYGQICNGCIAGQLNPVTSVSVRYPWVDANHDTVAQASEVIAPNPASFLALTGNWDPANPGSPTTKNTIDSGIKNDQTQEFIIGIDKELSKGFAMGVSYIWRKYSDFTATWTNGVSTTGSDYVPVTYTAPSSACPASQNAYCPAITYYQPTSQLGAITTLTNSTFYRSFNGIEFTARKRMANHWSMNFSGTYNSAIQNYPSGSYQDPTNISLRDGYQYDYATSGSGIGNVYVNAKWMFKLSGIYQAPGGVSFSAFYNTRQGYPFERFITTPSRANGAGTASVLLDNVGESRLPTYQNLDFHVERPVKVNNIKFVPGIDIFNVANSNIVQAIRGTQNASNANNIQAIVAPRVLRFGVRVSW